MDLSWLWTPARIHFCETTLDGLIKHPADTWTNVGPLIAGIAILSCTCRTLERLLGAAALWTGIASAYFHASNTILGETLDLSGMFMFIMSIAALQQHRSSPGIGATRLVIVVLLATVILTGLSVLSTFLASPMFAMIVVVVVVRGILDRKLGPWAWAMVGTFLIAWLFWWLDFLHILCSPSNHILTGHGVWHLLNGVVFWFAYLHFKASETAISESQASQVSHA